MLNLDHPDVYRQYDPQRMLTHIHNLPQMCRRAWQMAAAFDLPQYLSDINKVVVLGMGGSAIGGDLVASLVADEAKTPLFIHRDYNLPAFVDKSTLVIASSYSGTTEETLSAFSQALDTDAKKLVITTGGRLKSLAEEHNIAFFSFDYKAQPRAALPFSFLPILNFMQRLGIIEAKDDDVAKAVLILEQLSSEVNETVSVNANKAKQLAQTLYGKLAVIYGAGITAEVARRWKTQLNENSKAWAFHEAFPELDHNAVVGYQFPEELAPGIAVVMLQSSHLPPQILRRYNITAQLLNKAGIGYQMVNGSGKSALAQIMSLVLFGDYASYYLAILNRINPTPVEAIDFLKGELGKEQN
jgi:glucose/mannose-6-phosphate isomerase